MKKKKKNHFKRQGKLHVTAENQIDCSSIFCIKSSFQYRVYQLIPTYEIVLIICIYATVTRAADQ